MEKDNLIDHVKFNYHMTTKHIAFVNLSRVIEVMIRIT